MIHILEEGVPGVRNISQLIQRLIQCTLSLFQLFGKVIVLHITHFHVLLYFEKKLCFCIKQSRFAGRGEAMDIFSDLKTLYIVVVFPKRWYTQMHIYIVLGRNTSYFVRNNSKSSSKYTEEDVYKILEFLIDNIFFQCGGRVFSTNGRHPNGNKLCSFTC